MGTTTASGTEVIDPVCGMKVDPDAAAGSYEHEGRTYYFCSKSCLDKFRREPDSFIGGGNQLADARRCDGRQSLHEVD